MNYIALVCYNDCEHLEPWCPEILGVFPTKNEAVRCLDQFTLDYPENGYAEAYVIYPRSNGELFWRWELVWDTWSCVEED